MQQHKIAVIGLDNWYHSYPIAEYCQSGKRLLLAGASDPNADKLAQYERKFDVPVVYADWRTLLEQCDCDSVMVCNATAQHEEVVVEAARRGKHIICDKPMAFRHEAALRMQQAVEESGVHCTMMHNYRFSPLLQKARSLLEADAIGRIVSLTMRSHAALPEDWPGSGNPGWYAVPELSGGGGFIDHAAHTIDVVIWMFGEQMPTAVSGVVGNYRYDHFPGDDGGVALLEFDRAVAQVESSWNAPKAGASEILHIVGVDGEITASRAGRPCLELRRKDGPVWLERFDFEMPYWTDILMEVIEAFYDSIENGLDSPTPIAQGVRVARVLDAFRASVASGKRTPI